MTFPLTKEMVAAAYDFLCTTPPFNRWNLPDSEDVKFEVSRRNDEFGRYRWNGTKHVITMSGKAIGQTLTLFQYTAHEMIHMHLEIIGHEAKRGGLNVHNAAFRKFAASACRSHGFDPKAFY